MAYQMTFAVITCALIGGAVAERMKFSAFMLFCAVWLFVVYIPTAHWVWGGGFLQKMGLLDFAGGTVVHINAGVAGLVAALVIGKRQGFGRENLAPFDLSLAVVGTGLLWVGWFGFNGGSALAAGSRAVFAIVATHLAACAGALMWSGLEWIQRGKPSVLGLISGAVAGLGTITPASGYILPWHGVVIGLIAGAVCYFMCTAVKQRCAMTTRSTCSACMASAAFSARCWPACSRPVRSPPRPTIPASPDCSRATRISSSRRRLASA